MIPSTENIKSREELAAFVAALASEVQRAPNTLGEQDLRSFLEALAAWINDMDGYFLNRGEPVPDHPSWRTFAQMLIAATTYE